VIGILKQKTPANILVLLVMGLLIKLPMFLHPHIATIQPKDGILFHWILQFLEQTGKKNPVLYPCLAFLLLFTQAIGIVRLINDYRMMNRTNYLPGMSYLIITSFFPEWNYFSAPLLINTLLIWVLGWLFKIYNNPRGKGIIFNVGVMIGISSFIFFPSVTFVIWVLLALMIMRPFRINEWLLCLLGLTSPYYFYGVYLFLSNQWQLNKIAPYLTVQIPSLQQSIWLAISALLLMIPFLAGGYFVQDNLRRMLIQIRKGWSILLIYLLVAIFVPFVNTSNTFENWVMAAVPFSTFHACTYFYPTRKIFPLILFWVSVAFILFYQYAGPGW
jgi:hypothetical protein